MLSVGLASTNMLKRKVQDMGALCDFGTNLTQGLRRAFGVCLRALRTHFYMCCQYYLEPIPWLDTYSRVVQWSREGYLQTWHRSEYSGNM